MKAKFFALFVFFLLSGLSLMAQTTKVALQHQGNVTMYGSTELSKAITASMDGDTLFLTNGSFNGNVTLNKKVSIIGCGTASRIEGSVTIAIPNSATLTSALLENQTVTGTTTVTSAIGGLKIKKCSLEGNISFTGNITDAIFENCYFYSMLMSSYVKGLTVINSKICYLGGEAYTTDASQMINCNIKYLCEYIIGSTDSYKSYKGQLNNCIINYANYSYPCVAGTTLINCIYGNTYVVANCMIQDCYYESNPLDSSLNSSIETQTMIDQGYVGTDGTVIGCAGGPLPFTMEPNGPVVTSSTIAVDAVAKKLNVNIQVTTK